MKQIFFFVLIIFLYKSGYAQEDNKKTLSGKEKQELMSSLKSDSMKYIRMAGDEACKCIDSISLSNKNNNKVSNEIADCIHKKVLLYQMSKKMFSSLFDTTKNTVITIASNKESDEYKRNYYEIERWLMDSCKSMKEAVASRNEESKYSKSKNADALKNYYLGSEKITDEHYAEAISYFEKAVAIDPKFAFCWDNLGICYRRTGRYDDAMKAYKKSLELDPKGITPLQNIPVVYEHQKKYKEALEAYKNLIGVYKKDPEGYYGLGRMYILLEDYENGLENLCKAYNMYIETQSPYRADAEKVIGSIYYKMKDMGKEKDFDRILKEYHIKTE